MKDLAVSTLGNGLGDRTEMPWWNLPLPLTLARYTRAPHHQTFVLPHPEYKAVLYRHGWQFSFWLDLWQNCSKLSWGILGFPVVCFSPHSVLQSLSVALLQESAEEAFKGRCDSEAEVLCFISSLESCSWNSKHAISLETFFVCPSEEIAGRRRPVSSALEEKPVGSEYTGDII